MTAPHGAPQPEVNPETHCTSTGCGRPIDDPVHRDEFGCWCKPDNHDPHCHWLGTEWATDTEDDDA